MNCAQGGMVTDASCQTVQGCSDGSLAANLMMLVLSKAATTHFVSFDFIGVHQDVSVPGESHKSCSLWIVSLLKDLKDQCSPFSQRSFTHPPESGCYKYRVNASLQELWALYLTHARHGTGRPLQSHYCYDSVIFVSKVCRGALDVKRNYVRSQLQGSRYFRSLNGLIILS
jgi:hypothetical protein